MLVPRFMQWLPTASASQRAQGARSLADAYLHCDLDDNERDDAEVALTVLLDDTSPLVRKALADAMAASSAAPHAVIVALANDQSDVSSSVLRYSPLLSDSELIDCAAIGDAFAQASVALRPVVAAPVSAALAEVGRREALVALAVNPGAVIPAFSLRRMVARFGHDAELREGLLSRDDLPAGVRSDLVTAAANALRTFVDARGWMSSERMARVIRDTCDRAHLIIAADQPADTDGHGARELASHLRQSGQLTSSLILRAILSGNRRLFEAAMVELAGLPERKALGLLRQSGGAGFPTVYRAANMAPALLPAFQAALAAMATATGEGPSARLSRSAVAQVLAACETINAGELNSLLALLRRFEAEAARENAREAMEIVRGPSVELLPSLDPYVQPPRSARRNFEIDLVRFEADLAA